MLAEAMAPRFKAMKYLARLLRTRDLSDVPPEYIVPGAFASTTSFDVDKESREFEQMLANPPVNIHLDPRNADAFQAHVNMTRALPYLSRPVQIFEEGTQRTVQVNMGSMIRPGYTDDDRFLPKPHLGPTVLDGEEDITSDEDDVVIEDGEFVRAQQESLLDFLLSSQERSPVLVRLRALVLEKFHVDVPFEEYSMPIAFCLVAFIVIVSGVFGTIVTPSFIENTIKRQGQVLRASTTIYESCMAMAQPLAEFFSHVLEMGPILPTGSVS